MDRQFRILWGPTLETVLDFSWPVVGDTPLVWRGLRDGSERLDGATTVDVSVTGKDYFLNVTAKWFDLQHETGATGLQAFIDWANAGNAFTLVPDPIGLPTLTVTGCYLDAPFDSPSWTVEQGGEMTIDLVIRHPSQDLGLAWRGLFFEYVAGQSLTDPVAYTFTRASVGYEIGSDGYLHQRASGVAADGHYGDPLVGAGGQGTLVSRAFTNDIPNPEDLTNATWTKSGDVIIATNKAAAPDLNITADQLVEGVGVTQFHAVIAPAVTIAAGDTITALCFVRNSGRFRGLFRVTDAGNANGVGVNYNLSTASLTNGSLGTGTLTGSSITTLSGGWYMIWFRGTIDAATTTAYTLKFFLQDAGGNNSYTGDGASGAYFWGCTAVHTAANLLASYTPTSSAADLLYAPFPYTVTALNNCTVYVKVLRPFWADATDTFGVFPATFAIGYGATAPDPSFTLFAGSTTRVLAAFLQTGAGTSQSASVSIPAGASWDMIGQFKNLLTGGQTAIDVGSGLTAFSTAAPAISDLGSQFIRIGQYTERWNGAVAIIKVAPGLQTLAYMRAA